MTTTTQQPTQTDQLAQLEQLMRRLIEVHEKLDEIGTQRDAAMRQADLGTLASCIERESALVAEVAEAEKQRVEVVRALAERMGSSSGSATTMSWIAERAAEPQRQQLLELAARLRELIVSVRKRSESSKLAAEMLANHMTGLVRQVHARLAHTRTYGKRGLMQQGSSVVSMLDVRS